MGRNNEDARNGLERADMPGFEGTMGGLDSFVSKYTPNANKRARKEKEEDVDADAKNSRMFDGGFPGIV